MKHQELFTPQLIRILKSFNPSKMRVCEIDPNKTFIEGNVKSYEILSPTDVDNILNSPEGLN